MADEDGKESVPPDALGSADIVEEMFIGDRDILFIKVVIQQKHKRLLCVVLIGICWKN